MRRRSATSLGAVAVLILAGAAAGPASAAPTSAAATPAAATPGALPPGQLSAGSAPVRTITLVTGDRISVATDGSGRVSMRDSAGHRNTQYLSRTVGGHLQVIPTTAMGLFARGKLDPRLFDVTELLADGYDDRSASLPLLVSYQNAASLRGTTGLTVGRDLTSAKAIAVRQPRSTAARTWTALTASPVSLRPGIRKIWLDGVRKPVLDVSVPQIGAPAAWKAGYDGTGVTVGIIDTGVDGTHPDLAGKVIEAKGFTDAGDTIDTVGHGTHVASTVAGTGAASNGTYKGVAPGATLYSAKVCTATGCTESAILAGMQWVAEKGVRVANMSLGGTNQPGRDPIEEAVENLTATYGTLFVVASGNDHLWTGSPASAPSALAVGAVDKKNVGADFSSHGIKYDDYAVKPELTAPGVDITAARSADSIDGATLKYRTMSGTSMAAPHVAGAVALLAQAHPGWTHDQLKDTLVSSATPNGDPWFVQGAGRVDVARAFGQPVAASPSTLAFGLQKLPHEEDPPVSKTVTYHNGGTAPVTLAVTIPASDAAGKPLPAGLFTVEPASVTVPAGGDAPVTVTATPAAIPWKDVVGAVLTAAGEGVTVRTPMSMAAQIEGFDVTVTGLDRAGSPSSQ
ncbi:MAG: hypothetical protein QOI78_5624, partial [Actinomycetota bacterium]|nr:hypothetical protein [Actinomycetota bacterium]